MALIICPNCLERVTSYVSYCPNCDFAIKELFDHAHRLEYAANPATDRTILEFLANDDTEVQRCIAANPSTPTYCLNRLLNETDDEGVLVALANNPGISSIQLQQLLKEGSDAVVRAAIRHPGIREWDLKLAAQNPNLGADLLLAIAQKDNYSALFTVVRNPNLTKEACIEMLVRFPAKEAQTIIASGLLTAEDIMPRLSSLPLEKKKTLARLHSVPKEVQNVLANDTDESIRLALASGSAVGGNVALAQKLLNDPSESVRSALAGNPSTPDSILIEIIKTADGETARRIIYKDGDYHSGEISQEVMGALSNSSNPDVRVRVASSEKTPADIRWKLAGDPDPEVRKALTLRWKTAPWGLLEALTRDNDPSVAASARQYLRMSHDPWLNS